MRKAFGNTALKKKQHRKSLKAEELDLNTISISLVQSQLQQNPFMTGCNNAS